MEAGLASGFFGCVGQRRSRFGVRSGRSKWVIISRRLAPPSRGGGAGSLGLHRCWVVFDGGGSVFFPLFFLDPDDVCFKAGQSSSRRCSRGAAVQARRFRSGFSVVGAREAVCCWSCQPSMACGDLELSFSPNKARLCLRGTDHRVLPNLPGSVLEFNCGSNFVARVCAEYGVAYGLVVALLVVVANLV
ncbi:hypothetical protein Bca52824_002004 [Brassica carinata]|uniref:Uncharacterized protein n=1 Tax=Brassica carinata TaxID=52824 RepID=A0A8X7WHB7_BRACI|nr:hypothetical protein Bca52824_002004 [Brassica carinata]